MQDAPVTTPSARFPATLPEPASYYRGAEAARRIRARNAVVFLRTSRATLQQRNFANRVHHRHVLVLALETSGKVSLDGQLHPLQPGEALLVLPYQFHHYLDLGQDDLRWLFVTFELDEGAEQLAELGQTILHPEPDDIALWERIVGLWAGRGEPAELLAVLELLLVRLARRAAPLPGGASPGKAKGSWIARAEGLVARSVMEGQSLAQVARRAGLSERQLRTRFEREMGVSIRRYKANYQLHRAASLMQRELPLSRVAELSGFNSQAVFTRFIRRETGLTPSAWRKSFLNTPAERL